MEQSMSQHLQKSERIQIQTLLEVGKSIDDIALYLGRHRSCPATTIITYQRQL